MKIALAKRALRVVTMRAHTPIHDRGTEHETLIQHLQHPLKRNKRQKSELGSLGNVCTQRGGDMALNLAIVS